MNDFLKRVSKMNEYASIVDDGVDKLDYKDAIWIFFLLIKHFISWIKE